MYYVVWSMDIISVYIAFVPIYIHNTFWTPKDKDSDSQGIEEK